jgi:hypothetical protein
MDAEKTLQEIVAFLYWPHASGAKEDGGRVSRAYDWRCGCSAFEIEDGRFKMTWCDHHAAQQPA